MTNLSHPSYQAACLSRALYARFHTVSRQIHTGTVRPFSQPGCRDPKSALKNGHSRSSKLWMRSSGCGSCKKRDMRVDTMYEGTRAQRRISCRANQESRRRMLPRIHCMRESSMPSKSTKLLPNDAIIATRYRKHTRP